MSVVGERTGLVQSRCGIVNLMVGIIPFNIPRRAGQEFANTSEAVHYGHISEIERMVASPTHWVADVLTSVAS